MDFDAAVVSYEELLQLFWQSHDPVRPAFKTQYASLVLAHDTAQLASARHSARGLEAVLSRRLATRIEMLNRFWLAEDYHQKYEWKHSPELLREFPLVEDYSLWAVARSLGKPLPRISDKVGEIAGA